jgi:hypothetical protein
MFLVFPVCPAHGHSPGKLCPYGKGRLRCCKWCGEPCLANWSAVSIPTNPGTLTRCILFCFASLVKNWWHYQTSLEFIWKLATTDNTDVPTRTALFSTTHALMEHISAWNAVVWSPRLKLCPVHEPRLYIPARVPLLVLYPSVYQSRPNLTASYNSVCHN